MTSEDRESPTQMASTSSHDTTHVSLSSTLSLPKSCTKQTTNKIENLIEYSYIPKSAQINESSFPLISPYQLYMRGNSFTRSIKTLISTKRDSATLINKVRFNFLSFPLEFYFMHISLLLLSRTYTTSWFMLTICIST